jgi:hypothetical protein
MKHYPCSVTNKVQQLFPLFVCHLALLPDCTIEQHALFLGTDFSRIDEPDCLVILAQKQLQVLPQCLFLFLILD